MSTSSLLDQLRQSTGGTPAPAAAPAPAPAPVVAQDLPPEVLHALTHPSVVGMQTANQVLDYWQEHRTLPGQAVAAAPTAAPVAVTAPAAAPAAPAPVAAETKPAPKVRGSKANEAKLIIGCATGGLSVQVCEDYLALLGRVG